jgi:hypothetical protein
VLKIDAVAKTSDGKERARVTPSTEHPAGGGWVSFVSGNGTKLIEPVVGRSPVRPPDLPC